MAITTFPIPTSSITLLPTTGALNLAHEFWAQRLGVDVRVPLSQVLALFQTTGIAMAGASSAVTFRVGAQAPQSSAPLSARGMAGGNSFEFGHTNTSGFGNTIGHESATGKGFVAFSAEHGTNADTYRTRGIKGTVIKGDKLGGLQIQTVATASADNQTATDIFAISTAGVITSPLTTNAPFTSPGIDDNCSGERLELSDTGIIVGNGVSASGYNVSRVVNDGYINIAGGTAGAGSNLVLVGGTHASLANDFSVQRGATAVIYYDDSASSHTFNANAGGLLARIDGSTTAFTAVAIRLGQDSTSVPGSGNNLSGVAVNGSTIYASVGGNAALFNHTTTGNMVSFNLAGANQGFISGSGATITYGAFMGSHIGQMLGSAANIELLRGSIVKTVDVMSEWIAFTYTDSDGLEHTNEKVPAGLKIGDTFDFTYEREVFDDVKHVDDVPTVETEEIDEPYTDYDFADGNAVAIKRKRKKRIPVYDNFPLVDKGGTPVMETVQALDADGAPAFDIKPALNRRKKPIYDEIDGEKQLRMVETPRMVEQQIIVRVPRRVVIQQERIERVKTIVADTVKATVVLMENDTLVKWELTAETGCERPYGVIAWHDSDESDDWLISGLGAYVCRIKAGVKVKGGDLIQSSDVAGCGEPITEKMGLSALQIAKRHVATVGANIPQPIYKNGPLYYPDKSYIVPATIHCG